MPLPGNPEAFLNAPGRRRVLKTLFCSSALLAVNLRPSARPAGDALPPDPRALHLLALGDFGTSGADQLAVAAAMRRHCRTHRITPGALLMLGDNIYSTATDGFSTTSDRWRDSFEDVYPSADFPGPCWAVLGNHDYRDNPGGDAVQLAYARRPGTRWRMPAKWYRFDLGPAAAPLATVIALDSNLPSGTGGFLDRFRKHRVSLTETEAAEQLAWLERELESPRAPFTFVMAHHPLYSEGKHGDSGRLIGDWGPLFQRHRVHAYLCGHDHDLQHLELDGLFTSFILSGGGGARTRSLRTDRHMPFGREAHGFTHIQLSRDSVVFSHHDKAGALLHRFRKLPDGTVEFP